ncbi:gephyrin-like molybdotransferase Glp [Magnetospira sp. QH-2]|uniref:molybdopterin molybdotransferase MoeA n=1 Tax=Magnetospira sp. (strain QH-2) TaxID=1288970 RepID=UPI0003E81841|nr:gephyrin-like molybdotransferase Glp [Magnetospira sp. QH-2]CCQ73964.1 Putative Molybdopterin biosynthesis protein moeA [Magnetospira sp. QH-2]
MISVAEALETVLSGIVTLSAETISVADAVDRVLAEDVSARLTQPPMAVSAMDGYAVRACDVKSVPTALTCVGAAPAGGTYEGAVSEGECVRIFTGAPIPAGTDAVIMQEDTAREGDRVLVKEPYQSGKFVRQAGLDFSAGKVLLRAGHRLKARDIGLCAAMNVPWLRVTRKPRVAILATGDELVMPGDPVGPSQIISSNSLAVAAFVRKLGGDPLDLGIARDTPEALDSLLAGADRADLLVTLGGASVGDHDLVVDGLTERGFELGFHKIAMRPGKPLIFGHVGSTAVLGLPGNPVSAGVTSVLFLRPALEKMAGLPPSALPRDTATLGCDLPENDRRQDYLRADLYRERDGTFIATPFDKQDSAMLALFARADCLVVRTPFAPPAKAGDKVDIIRF